MKFITYSDQLFNNTFVLAHNDKYAIIIDPCFDCSGVIADIKKYNLTPLAIITTHGHFDHLFGIPQITKEYPDIDIYMHHGDDFMYKNINAVMKQLGFDLETGEMKDYKDYPTNGKLSLNDEIQVEIVHVPGHTAGSCFLTLIENNKPVALFTGDVVYSEGKCGFWEHSEDQKEHNIQMQKFYTLNLPRETPMFAGHGPTSFYGVESDIPRTVPGQEK